MQIRSTIHRLCTEQPPLPDEARRAARWNAFGALAIAVAMGGPVLIALAASGWYPDGSRGVLNLLPLTALFGVVVATVYWYRAERRYWFRSAAVGALIGGWQGIIFIILALSIQVREGYRGGHGSLVPLAAALFFAVGGPLVFVVYGMIFWPVAIGLRAIYRAIGDRPLPAPKGKPKPAAYVASPRHEPRGWPLGVWDRELDG
jgi:hypothetical protein